MLTYPPDRAIRFLCVIGFSFFVLILHSVDKRQTYARLRLPDTPSRDLNREAGQETFTKSTELNFESLWNSLTEFQMRNVEKCTQAYDVDSEIGEYLNLINPNVRYKLHEYLDSNSFVIEVGGYEGDEVREFFGLYEIGRYVILEPVWEYYDILRERTNDLPQEALRIYNIGLGARDELVNVRKSGKDTSLYKYMESESSQSESRQTESRNDTAITSVLNIMNVEKFLIDMGIGQNYGYKHQLDLLSMDCAGCEYDVLDYLLTSPNVLRNIRTIQFQSHRVKGHEKEMIKKYCAYQEVLSRTHEILFQHKFSWEAWTFRNKM